MLIFRWIRPADTITFKGKELCLPGNRYYMLNKPMGCVSATEDPKEQTVLDLFPAELRKDLFPVGRLDKDTEGLLLLTTDGALSHQLISPKKEIYKTYLVTCEKSVTKEDLSSPGNRCQHRGSCTYPSCKSRSNRR